MRQEPLLASPAGGPDIRPGDTVRVHQKIKEGSKEHLQMFEGVVLARKHGKGISATITVRKISSGVGVERIFPIHSPSLDKIEVVKRSKVRRAKLYYLREAKGKKARLKTAKFGLAKEEQNKETELIESEDSSESERPADVVKLADTQA